MHDTTYRVSLQLGVLAVMDGQGENAPPLANKTVETEL